MVTKREFENALEIIKLYAEQLEKLNSKLNDAIGPGTVSQDELFSDTAYYSARLFNVLANNRRHLGFHTDTSFLNLKVKDFSQISRTQLFKCRHFGDKMKREIESLCRAANIEMLP
ncbi:MAG TPA: hypothetical protein VMU83_08810 [Hanamia sp.]|nr:hypothetical protein [Hanamia sp.]